MQLKVFLRLPPPSQNPLLANLLIDLTWIYGSLYLAPSHLSLWRLALVDFRSQDADKVLEELKSQSCVKLATGKINFLMASPGRYSTSAGGEVSEELGVATFALADIEKMLSLVLEPYRTHWHCYGNMKTRPFLYTPHVIRSLHVYFFTKWCINCFLVGGKGAHEYVGKGHRLT